MICLKESEIFWSEALISNPFDQDKLFNRLAFCIHFMYVWSFSDTWHNTLTPYLLISQCQWSKCKYLSSINILFVVAVVKINASLYSLNAN